MLSLVPLTGWSGQISLAQITFVGVGAWAFIEFSSSGGQVFGVDLFINGSPWGLLVAAAGRGADRVADGVASAATPGPVPRAGHDGVRAHGRVRHLRPTRGVRQRGASASHRSRSSGSGSTNRSRSSASTSRPTPRTCCSSPRCSASSASAWSWLRRGRFGRRLVAMRDSPAACATLGVNLFSTKLAVFAISAAIAGLRRRARGHAPRLGRHRRTSRCSAACRTCCSSSSAVSRW